MNLYKQNTTRFFLGILTSLYGVFFIVPATSQTYDNPGSGTGLPDKGIKITLSVFSGRPNPEWWLTSEAEYREILANINLLKITPDSVFNYNEWNQLGYASFWIEPRGLEKLPEAIHIWRNMAYIIQDKKNNIGYAMKADKLYEILVVQAEKRGQEKFFKNYRNNTVR